MSMPDETIYHSGIALTLEKAIRVAEQALPNMKIIGGLETAQKYYFNMIPIGVSSTDGHADSTVKFVDKNTGKFGQCFFANKNVLSDILGSDTNRSRISVNEKLQHHGILGQRWGVRRFQNKDGTLTRLGEKRYSDVEKSNDSDQNSSSLTDNQRKAIKIGAIATTTALATIGAVYLYRTGKLDSIIEKGKQAFSKTVPPVTDSKTFDPSLGFGKKDACTIRDDIMRTNPNRGKKIGYLSPFTFNCGNCTICMEMRMRGYDVEALGNDGYGMSVSQMRKFFINMSDEDVYKPTIKLPKQMNSVASSSFGKKERGEAVQKVIANAITNRYGPGSRGSMVVPTPVMSHWINWSNDGGIVRFFDGQNPDINLTSELFSQFANDFNSSGDCSNLSILRLDNLDLASDIIRDAVKGR